MSMPADSPPGPLAYAPKWARDTARTGSAADSEQPLRAAAEYLLWAVESPDPDERAAMLGLARRWLRRSERTGNAGDPSYRAAGQPPHY
jgi:hypothetical protein